MLKNRFLFIPLIIFLLALGIDRIFMIETIQTYFTKTVSEINFFHKPYLFDELKTYLAKRDRKKVLVIFGNSRALLFNNKYIESKYPDWILFNFSVPGGGPDYFLFWLEKFKAENVKPDFVLVDSSLEFYNLTPMIKLDESLVNGLELNFVLRYSNRYSKSELSNFLSKRLFKTYQYRPKITTILQRTKNNFAILEAYRKWRKQVLEKLIQERGSASSEFYKNKTQTEEIISKYAVGDTNSYLIPFTFHEDILSFQRDNLRILKEMKLPSAFIMVRVAPPFFQSYKTKLSAKDASGNLVSPYSLYLPKMNELSLEFQIPFLNMNDDPSYTCNAFTDASHMASECFSDYTDFIFAHVLQMSSK
jgi:hypothetical protein